MRRLRLRSSAHGSQPSGKYAGYAPRVIGFAILIAALLFIVIGIATG